MLKLKYLLSILAFVIILGKNSNASDGGGLLIMFTPFVPVVALPLNMCVAAIPNAFLDKNEDYTYGSSFLYATLFSTMGYAVGSLTNSIFFSVAGTLGGAAYGSYFGYTRSVRSNESSFNMSIVPINNGGYLLVSLAF